MKKFFAMVFAAALFAACGDASSESAADSNDDDNSAISKIETEMGLTICDCLPKNMPMPDFSTASKEVREKYNKGVEGCIQLQSAIIDKVGHDGFGSAQNKCK
jgi:hypothetical protein